MTLALVVSSSCSGGSAGARSTAPAPAPAPATRALGDPSAFRFKHVDEATGGPVRFNPCQPLHYVVNPSGAPPRAMEKVEEVMATVSAATGIEFVYEGITDEEPRVVVVDANHVSLREPISPHRYGSERWSPILIAWGSFGTPADDPGAEPLTGGTGFGQRAIGEGGVVTYVTGVVVMNVDLPLRFVKRALLHEVGHVMGLTHVEEKFQLMAHVSEANTASGVRARYGAGDLNGLRQLGREAGCLPELTPRNSRLIADIDPARVPGLVPGSPPPAAP